MQTTVIRLYSSRQVRWDQILRDSRKIHDMFFCRLLSMAKVWICDGTFNYAPKHFKQLYTIHGFVNGFNIPLAFFLSAIQGCERMFRMILKVDQNVT